MLCCYAAFTIGRTSVWATTLFLKQTDRSRLRAIKPVILHSEIIPEPASVPSAHASTIVDTDDGLLAAWFGGTYERQSRCEYLYFQTSKMANGANLLKWPMAYRMSPQRFPAGIRSYSNVTMGLDPLLQSRAKSSTWWGNTRYRPMKVRVASAMVRAIPARMALGTIKKQTGNHSRRRQNTLPYQHRDRRQMECLS